MTMYHLHILYHVSCLYFVLLVLQSSYVVAGTANFKNFTIFSILREMPNNDPVQQYIQTNAIWSWVRMVPQENIIIFFTDSKSCSFLKQSYSNIKCQNLLTNNCYDKKFNRPYMKCVFDFVQQNKQTPILMFVNGDIMLDESAFYSTAFISNHFQDFFAVGCRRDFAISQSSLTNTDPQTILSYGSINGKLHSTMGIDLIAFRTEAPLPMLPFLAGVYRWDNWLLSEVLLRTNTTVIDITQSTRIVHLQKNDPENNTIIPHKHRNGATYNDQLTKNASGYDYTLGFINNAHKLLIGDCQKEQCHLYDNFQQSEKLLLRRRANSEKYIAVLAVNTGYMPLAWNWICWAKRIQFQNYILLAEDLKAYETLRDVGEPVFISYNQSLSMKEKLESKYGTFDFQMIMLYRLDFLMRVLLAGYHFLSADMDGIWLSDPFKFISHVKSITLQGQTHKETKMSGGFVLVHATTEGRKFWREIVSCQQQNIIRIKEGKDRKRVISDFTEQECINDRLKMVKVKLLDPYLFPDGRSFFNQQLPQRRGIVPVVIHGNWIIGIDAKVKRFQAWDLMASENSTCTLPKNGISFDSIDHKSPMFLHIRILTYNRLKSLKRLLQSLQMADFSGDSVALEISIDYPPEHATAEERTDWNNVVTYLNQSSSDPSNFRWRHGPFSVNVQRQHIGILGQWTLPINHTNVQMLLEDDIVLSPHFYIFIRNAVNFYYYNKSNYDSRMFGLSLQHQHTVLGKRMGFPIRSIEKELSEIGTPTFYKYQLLGTWGTVFFPEHWSAFIQWLQKMDLKNFQAACTPGGLLSTEWWLQRFQHRMWTPWFIRFAFEKGWYSLYANFPKKEAFATSYRESGLNFNLTRGPMNPLITKLEPSIHLNFNRELPIFDFYFSKIEQASLLEYRSSLWHQAHYVNQCFVAQAKEFNHRTVRLMHTSNKKQVKKASTPARKLYSSTYRTNYVRSKLHERAQALSPSSCFQWSVFFEIIAIFPTLLVFFIWICFADKRRGVRRRKGHRR